MYRMHQCIIVQQSWRQLDRKREGERDTRKQRKRNKDAKDIYYTWDAHWHKWSALFVSRIFNWKQTVFPIRNKTSREIMSGAFLKRTPWPVLTICTNLPNLLLSFFFYSSPLFSLFHIYKWNLRYIFFLFMNIKLFHCTPWSWLKYSNFFVILSYSFGLVSLKYLIYFSFLTVFFFQESWDLKMQLNWKKLRYSSYCFYWILLERLFCGTNLCWGVFYTRITIHLTFNCIVNCQ